MKQDEQPNLTTPSSTEQAQDMLRTSTRQVQDKFHTDNYNIIGVIKVIELRQMSVKEMMAGLQLKGRDKANSSLIYSIRAQN